jgi:hypothetical protein
LSVKVGDGAKYLGRVAFIIESVRAASPRAQCTRCTAAAVKFPVIRT